jgi:hypothetical protein
MRLGWSLNRSGPHLFLTGTIWRSKPRRHDPVYHGTLPGWRCPHEHRREDTAIACAQREARRRRSGGGR